MINSCDYVSWRLESVVLNSACPSSRTPCRQNPGCHAPETPKYAKTGKSQNDENCAADLERLGRFHLHQLLLFAVIKRVALSPFTNRPHLIPDRDILVTPVPIDNAVKPSRQSTRLRLGM